MSFPGLSTRRMVVVSGVLVCAALAALLILGPSRASAACTPPASDYGSDTVTISVPLTSTYQTWSRIMPDNSTDNSYLLEVDGGSCYVVGGGSSIPANAWTWVDYQNGDPTSAIDINLTAGEHTLTLIGNAPNLEIDRLILTGDTLCVPTGTGDNCALPGDSVQPTVSIITPADGATVSGTQATVSATVSDTVPITKVEFYVDGSLTDTETTAPYSFNWDSTKVSNASHTLTAEAYDADNNTGTSTPVNVTVNNTVSSPYNNNIIVRQNGQAYYAINGVVEPIPNPAVRDCIATRQGAGQWFYVPDSVIDNDYTMGSSAYCDYSGDVGLNFVEEAGDPTVWLVHAGGMKQHVGGLCVVDAYTTVFKKFHVWTVPTGETVGYTIGPDYFGNPTICSTLPG